MKIIYKMTLANTISISIIILTRLIFNVKTLIFDHRILFFFFNLSINISQKHVCLCQRFMNLTLRQTVLIDGTHVFNFIYSKTKEKTENNTGGLCYDSMNENLVNVV